jgi:hypothetical protein
MKMVSSVEDAIRLREKGEYSNAKELVVTLACFSQ